MPKFENKFVNTTLHLISFIIIIAVLISLLDLDKLRSIRLSDIALFDIITATWGMYIVGDYFGYPKLGASLTIPIGMIVHRVIGIKTKL